MEYVHERQRLLVRRLTVIQDSSHVSATVRRWQLTETLRQLREQARLTHDQVVAELRTGQGKWSRPKLSRIENREQGVKPREVEQLLDVYGVTDQALRDWLVELASTCLLYTSPSPRD